MLRIGGGVDWRAGLDAAARRAGGRDRRRRARPLPCHDDPGVARSVADPHQPGVSRRAALAAGAAGRRAAHVIEPIAQVIYSDEFGHDLDDIPNEDSQLPEFDETNLFSLNRFPGLDRLETGLRANLGVSYTRYDPAGWSLGLTLGRVIRAEPDPAFWEGTGLAGRWSDYVGAVSLDFAWGLGLVNRALFDDGFAFRRNEFAMVYDGERGDLRAAYVYLAEDDSNPLRRAAARDQRVRARRRATASARTGSCAASGATTWRRTATCAPAPDHLRQRMRRVRPFGLAPLHLID